MGRSFFGRTDVDLYAGSINFARKISESPESYGLSEALAAEYQALNDVYRAKYQAAANLGTRTRAIVAAKNDAREKLRAKASDLARIINGSGVSDEQKLALGLSVPGAPAAVGELGQPDQFSFSLDGIGGLVLKWKCINRRTTGTVYKISRRIDGPFGDGTFTFLAISGKRKFVDYTVPPGSLQLTYQIQAVRSTAVGPVGMFNVTFGVHSSQQAMIEMAQARQKFAA